MRDAIAIALLGVVMFVVGAVYGGDSDLGVMTVDLPAAMAVAPQTYPDGSLSPDYRDAAVLTLQHAYREMVRELGAAQQHDAEIHRGACVPWEGR